MSKLSLSVRHLLVRHPAAPMALDPADVGTCLGLEMTLGAELPPSPQPVAAPARSGGNGLHWWQRAHPPKAQPA
ncbi:MAG: hypothetical protein OEU93_03625 [Rubrivivax sp.]|nr:hypothetical protein [Rubrivivax sp.]